MFIVIRSEQWKEAESCYDKTLSRVGCPDWLGVSGYPIRVMLRCSRRTRAKNRRPESTLKQSNAGSSSLAVELPAYGTNFLDFVAMDGGRWSFNYVHLPSLSRPLRRIALAIISLLT
jgi:hypothetical protein